MLQIRGSVKVNDTPPKSKFQQKLEEREAKERAEEAARAAQAEHDADLIPENPYQLTDADLALDQAILRLDPISIYNRYIGKKPLPVRRAGQTENIMIRCPNPTHEDKNPDAWIGLKGDKWVWACGPCEMKGGDIYDFAAIGKGYAYPNTYKKDGTFHKLKLEIAEDFGIHITKLPGGAALVSEPETDESDTPDTPDIPDKTDISDAAPQEISSDAQIIELYEEDENILIPKFDWSKVIAPDTFLYEYMKAVKVDDVPLEFHLFHALIGLGMALGKDVKLYDGIPVYGNLFVCTLGRSGSGKSRAKYHLDTLLREALPYKPDDPFSKGTHIVSTPGSAEMLIHNFQKPLIDPTDGKTVIGNAPVRGLVSYSELSSLVSRAGRMGSAIKPTLMQFYDMENTVTSQSLTHGKKEAQDPFCSAITSTQPKALKDLIGTSDDVSGFLNRWLYVLGTPKKKLAIGAVRVDMSAAVDKLEKIFGWAGTRKRDEDILWTPEAADRFTEFFHDRIEVDKRKIDSDMMVRIDLLMKKLILLFTANIKEDRAPVECIDSAIELYEYLLAGFAVPASQISRTNVGDLQQAIMNIAMKQYKLDGKGVTLRQISKTLWRRNFSAKLINDTVDALVKLGMLKLIQPSTGSAGRPTVRYKYVD